MQYEVDHVHAKDHALQVVLRIVTVTVIAEATTATVIDVTTATRVGVMMEEMMAIHAIDGGVVVAVEAESAMVMRNVGGETEKSSACML